MDFKPVVEFVVKVEWSKVEDGVIKASDGGLCGFQGGISFVEVVWMLVEEVECKGMECSAVNAAVFY